MSEQFTEREEQLVELKEDTVVAEMTLMENTPKSHLATKPKSIKKLLILGALIVVIAVTVSVIFIPSKFEKVKNECVHIAGMVSGSGDYFMIDTYPDNYENMDERVVSLLRDDAQDNALEAIRYANNELGFNGSVYSKMMETTALMGRQSEENNKYKVSWTYHPDDGLEVTYEKK